MMSRQQDTLDDFIPVDTSNHETLQELLKTEKNVGYAYSITMPDTILSYVPKYRCQGIRIPTYARKESPLWELCQGE